MTTDFFGRKVSTWDHPSWWHLMITLPWIVGTIFFLFSAKSDQAIAARERLTSGIIKRHEPSNHDRYGYDFTVDGKAYSGWQSPIRREFIIDERVTVYYDPFNPTKNALYTFADAWGRAIGPISLMTFGILVVVLYIFIRNRSILKLQEIADRPA